MDLEDHEEGVVTKVLKRLEATNQIKRGVLEFQAFAFHITLVDVNREFRRGIIPRQQRPISVADAISFETDSPQRSQSPKLPQDQQQLAKTADIEQRWLVCEEGL